MMKKILNNPSDVVTEMLAGFVQLHDHVHLLPETHVIARTTPQDGKVAIISGGGSGHEPAHAG